MKKLISYILLIIVSISVFADFDRTNPVNLLDLQNEVALDPIGMGYSSAGGTPPLLELFNNPVKNVGNDTVGRALTPRVILNAIVPSELTVGTKFSDGEREWLRNLLRMSASLDDNLDEFKPKFRALFNRTPQTETMKALLLLSKRISRAEVLFGVDTIISKRDWLAARDFKQ